MNQTLNQDVHAESPFYMDSGIQGLRQLAIKSLRKKHKKFFTIPSKPVRERISDSIEKGYTFCNLLSFRSGFGMHGLR